MKRFANIKFFQDFLYLCLIHIKSVKASVEQGVENTKSIKNITIAKILGKSNVDKISNYLGLLYVSNKIFSIFLLRFLSISIIKL